MRLIVDASVIVELVNNIENYRKLREKLISGDLSLKIPETVKNEVYESLSKTEREYFDKLLPLVAQFLDYITVPLTPSLLSKAAEISRKFEVSVSTASCVALSITSGEIYVTADQSIVRKLKKEYPVLHLEEIHFFR